MLTSLTPTFTFVVVLGISIAITRFFFTLLESRPPEERRVRRWGRSGVGAVMSSASVAALAGFFTLCLLTAALKVVGLPVGGPEAPWIVGCALAIVLGCGIRDSRHAKRKKKA